MDFSSTVQIASVIRQKFGESSVIFLEEKAIQPFIEIAPTQLLKICKFLYTSSEYYFDFLNCITAIDNGSEEGKMELIYHLTSIPFEKSVILKITFPRNDEHGLLPKVASVSSVWKTADWHEREAFDLLGINFENHPDLRRILMPADWEGHPLRKDYKEQEKYHGIKVKY